MYNTKKNCNVVYRVVSFVCVQELKVKLSDCLPLQDHLKSLADQLTLVSDAASAAQFVTDLSDVSRRHADTSADIEANIERLREMVKLWDDVRREVDVCSVALRDTQQQLTASLPHHQHDLYCEADKLQVDSLLVHIVLTVMCYHGRSQTQLLCSIYLIH